MIESGLEGACHARQDPAENGGTLRPTRRNASPRPQRALSQPVGWPALAARAVGWPALAARAVGWPALANRFCDVVSWI